MLLFALWRQRRQVRKQTAYRSYKSQRNRFPLEPVGTQPYWHFHLTMPVLQNYKVINIHCWKSLSFVALCHQSNRKWAEVLLHRKCCLLSPGSYVYFVPGRSSSKVEAPSLPYRANVPLHSVTTLSTSLVPRVFPICWGPWFFRSPGLNIRSLFTSIVVLWTELFWITLPP